MLLSLIGKVKTFKVVKTLSFGAFLSIEGDKRNYFIHRSEIDKGDESNKIIQGKFIQGRIIGERKLRDGSISYQVSTKEIDNEYFEKELLEEKIDQFLKESSMKLKAITRHKERQRSERNRNRRR